MVGPLGITSFKTKGYYGINLVEEKIMALPTSGLITAAMINEELGRSLTAPFSLNDSEIRALAGKTSGAISFQDFYGKSSEMVMTAPTSLMQANVASLFNGQESGSWAASTAKRLLVSSSIGPLIINSTFGGTLIIEVQSTGTISGIGGTGGTSGEGGIGGNALTITAATGVIVINNGVIRGGGGGGGRGGAGGNGSTSSTTNYSASGIPSTGSSSMIPATGWTEWEYGGDNPGGWGVSVHISGVFKASAGSGTSITASGVTYTRGSYVSMRESQTDSYVWYYNFSATTASSTTGGAGGAGARGVGADGSAGTGSNGTAGGTNAGTGGKGGDGGTWGTAGSTGSTGANGTVTNGATGSSGGAGGKAIHGYNRVSYSGSGTLIGGTSTS